MNEIKKLYENAEVEKKTVRGCYDYYNELGIDIWHENDCKNKDCNTCEANKSIQKYPPFTAEKQLELIKLFSNRELYINYQEDKYYIFTMNIGGSAYGESLDKALARYINNLWQSLTEEEKQQIKEILE